MSSVSWWFLLPLICYCIICVAPQRLKKRWLIFPRQAPTRHQFIGGIGIPADLEYESLVVGHVLKAEFFLPYNASVYRENSYYPEYKLPDQISARQKDIHNVTRRSKLRWDIYAYIIERLNNYGYNGEECLLRAICEANLLQFERSFNVFAELLHILLSPSTSLDAETTINGHYIAAEKLGRYGAQDTCSQYACKIALIDLVSKIISV